MGTLKLSNRAESGGRVGRTPNRVDICTTIPHDCRRDDTRGGRVLSGIVVLILAAAGVAKAEVAVRLPDEQLNVQDIQEIGGAVWLTAAEGSFRVTHTSGKPMLVGGRAKPVEVPRSSWMTVVRGDSVFFGTPSGPYWFNPITEKTEAIRDDQGRTLGLGAIEEVGGRIWLTSMGKTYQFNLNTRTAELVIKAESSPIEKHGEFVWLNTSEGYYLCRSGASASPRLVAPDERIEPASLREVGKQLWLTGAAGGVYWFDRDEEQVVAIAPEAPDGSEDSPSAFEVSDVKAAGEDVWLETPNGPYCFDEEGKTANSIEDESGNVLGESTVREVGGEVWFLAEDRTYWLKENQTAKLVQVEGSGAELESEDGNRPKNPTIREVGGRIWFETDDRTYYFTENQTAKPVLVTDGATARLDVQDVWKAGQCVLVTTETDVYRVNSAGNEATRLDADSNWKLKKGLDRYQTAEGLWFATDKGICWVGGAGDPQIVEEGDVTALYGQVLDDEVWLQANLGTFVASNEGGRGDGNGQLQRVFDTDVGPNLTSKRVGGQQWLLSGDHAYLREEGELVRKTDDNTEPLNFSTIGRRTWLRKGPKAYRLEETRLEPVLDGKNVVGVFDVDDEPWLATNRGVYRVADDDSGADLVGQNHELNVSRIEKIGERAWVLTSSGAYVVDEHVEFDVDLGTGGDWWKAVIERIIPGNVWVAGVAHPKVRYESRAAEEGEAIDRDDLAFSIIMHPASSDEDVEKFSKKCRENRFSDAEDFERSLTSGLQEQGILIEVRDAWGNRERYEARGYVLPGPAVVPVAVGLLWLVALVLSIALAPYVRFLHHLLMNPFLRTLGFFGFVPLVITLVPSLRRHIFRRYTRGLRSDEDFACWERRFVVPSEEYLPEAFGRELEEHRQVLLLGESGVGKTCYFKYLTYCYAARKMKTLAPRKVTPVFIPVALYEGESVEEAFLAQLQNYGGLTDKKLMSRLLQQGGFLILVDGLNEVGKEMRQKVSQFVNRHWKANYFCLSSQEQYLECARLEPFELAVFDVERIQELVRQRLGDGEADSLIEQFNDTTYEMCKLPQDLEFMLELAKYKQPLPQTKLELYQRRLAPLLDQWKEEGNESFCHVLYRRSYEMIYPGAAIFDDPDRQIPKRLRDGLIAARLLVRSGGQHLFRHDMVRAFLAAGHFGPRWVDILGDHQVTVDETWRSMLQFVILDMKSPDEAKEMFFYLPEKDERLAKSLFRWTKAVRPALVEPWEEDFNRHYGEVVLRVA